MASRRALIYTSGGAYKSGTTNNVYVSWTDQTGVAGCTSPANEPGTNAASTCKTRIWFARSTDGGTTWSAPVMINNQASLNDQFNQWLAVDETTGSIGVMYYDTVGDATRKKTNVWYQSSSTAAPPGAPRFKVTTAKTDETVAGADSGNQYGDYNGLSGYPGTSSPRGPTAGTTPRKRSGPPRSSIRRYFSLALEGEGGAPRGAAFFSVSAPAGLAPLTAPPPTPRPASPTATRTR